MFVLIGEIMCRSNGMDSSSRVELSLSFFALDHHGAYFGISLFWFHLKDHGPPKILLWTPGGPWIPV